MIFKAKNNGLSHNFKLNRARYEGHSRQECNGGCRLAELGRLSPRWHHSKEESRYCNQLLLFQKAGELRSYSSQKKYDLLDAHGKIVGYLMVDFEVIRADGRLEIHEYKGAMLMSSPEFRHKRALFSWNYPDIQYHTVGRKQIVL